MIRKTITVELEKGFETRPIAMLVQLASTFDSTIYLETSTKRINAKSIMGMMSLVFPLGEEIMITAEGSDEAAAIGGIEKYLANQS